MPYRVCSLMCPTCLVSYVLLCPTLLASYVLSCLTCFCASRASCFRYLVPYVPSYVALYEPFFFTSPVVSYLGVLYVLISPFVLLSFNALRSYFSVHLLLMFFWVQFTKVKTNIVCESYFEMTISIYQQYDIFELFETKC